MNMSTSLLYHAFGVRDYQYTRTEYVNGEIVFHAKPDPKLVCCPECSSTDVIRRGEKERRFRSSPIGSKLVWCQVKIPRVECRKCGGVRQIRIGFADGQNSYTKGWANHALELTRSMTIKDVASQLGASWDTIKDLKKNYLRKHFSKPSLKEVRRIAIDEICIGKGHRYVTLVMDLDSGAILFVGDGKSAESLKPFWSRLKRSRGRIEAVAIDMSAAYISAVKANLPDATLVFDHFHVVKLMNEKLTDLRRELYRNATLGDAKAVLKGSNWLLMKNPENLDEDRDESARLQEALKLNEPLCIAYYLKEDLRQLWNQSFPLTARLFLASWCKRAIASGIKQLVSMAATLTRLSEGLLNYYKQPISTGPLEGTNNKIKTVQRQHYGIRDREFFDLTLYSLHRMKYAIVG
jgi:transposase